jgi:Fe-S cluster biosynthesis and repair protein YggX
MQSKSEEHDMSSCGTGPKHDHGSHDGHDHGQAEPGARIVKCVKLQRELPGLDAPPMPGELGQKLMASVSRDGWKLWTEHSKMLINEYRLSLIDPKARTFLKEQCEQFFFGEGSALPPDYQPPPSK